jgi:hypothetical protein
VNKNYPTSVKLDPATVDALRKIGAEHNLGIGWLIVRAVQRFLVDYKREGAMVLFEKKQHRERSHEGETRGH